MLRKGWTDNDPCKVINLAEYRQHRNSRSGQPPGPPTLGGRKACSDTLLASWVVANGADRTQGRPGFTSARQRCAIF